jgi:hypothetical protein
VRGFVASQGCMTCRHLLQLVLHMATCCRRRLASCSVTPSPARSSRSLAPSAACASRPRLDRFSRCAVTAPRLRLFKFQLCKNPERCWLLHAHTYASTCGKLHTVGLLLNWLLQNISRGYPAHTNAIDALLFPSPKLHLISILHHLHVTLK